MSGASERWSDLLGLRIGHDIAALTLTGWAEVLAPYELLRRRIAHCPRCLEDMAEVGVVYEPLAWSLTLVDHCPEHQVALRLACPHCGGQQPALRLRGRVGICAHCDAWLGDATYGEVDEASSGPSRSIASLIPLAISRSGFSRALEHAIAEAGSQTALAKSLPFPRRDLSVWRRGISRPSLEGVLRLCAAGNWNVVEFLQGRLVPGVVAPTREHAGPPRNARIDWDGVRRRLSAAAALPNPPSLKALAHELGVDAAGVRRKFRSETDELVARRRGARQARAQARTNEAISIVVDITTRLLAAGGRATRRDVERLLPAPYQLRERALGDAWRSTRAQWSD